MRNSYFVLLVIGFSLFFGANSAFADITITTAPGSGAPGCEETSSGCYYPSTAKVSVGETVIFSNTDSAAHTFTSGDPDSPGSIQIQFDSGLAMAGSTFEWSPSSSGNVPYFCMVHPWMQGLIIIEGSSIQNSIVVTTNKYFYSEGEVIRITGEVKDLYSGTPVSLVVKNDKEIVALAQLTVGSDKRFSTEITAVDPMRKAGTYTIEVTYGTQNRMAITSFEFGGSTTTLPNYDSQITSNTVSVQGSSDLIGYKITGGKLQHIIPDMEANSLIVSIDATNYGSLTLTIPRSILDATINGEDDDFFVLVNGEEVDFDERTSSYDRTLTISFPSKANEIEIIGTFVIGNYHNIPTPTPTPTPRPTIGTISVTTDDYQYSPSDLVTIKVTTSSSANVAVSVVGPSGDSIVSRSISTDSRGIGSLQFKLPDSSVDGSYKVNTSATISGKNISDSTTFSVKSSVAKISIITLQPTDQQGNAVSSFTAGKLGFVKVGLSSSSTVNSLVTINLFDSELTSLGIGSFQTNLSSGTSEMTLSFFIPNDADIGNGNIYANVFSDWPSKGGVPLTGESSTQVRIQ